MTLDPDDWAAFRTKAHRMLDDIIDYIETIRDRPVWRPMPDESRAALREPLPREGASLEEVHERFLTHVLPFSTGNVHPRFTGWVHGGGNVYGMLAEMLAAGLNANLGGRDHAPIELEKQVIRWFADLFGFPAEASGLLVTGTSIANLMGVVIARVAALGTSSRRAGLDGQKLVAYASTAVHGCVPRAMDIAGLGTDALRLLPVDASHRMETSRLVEAIARDRAAGHRPFLIIATAGTVDIGAFDDLEALARISREHQLWLHVDGAFGALGMLSPELRPRMAGVAHADSVAFDFHKWGQVPYDAAGIVVRDGAKQLAAFASEAAYLRRETRGLAGGGPWPVDLGPDLSRGFRALKVWYTLEVVGADRLGAAIAHTCALARQLAARVDAEPELDRVAAVPLNIVCFRYRFSESSGGPGADQQNAALAADLQESGVAAPSTTTIDGRVWLRCAIVNHRTAQSDIDVIVDAVLAQGRRRQAASGR